MLCFFIFFERALPDLAPIPFPQVVCTSSAKRLTERTETDFWSLWDLGIIGTGVAFLIARVIGLAKDSAMVIDLSFDILSLEALFLVPR
jgi:hypothetical protein